MKNIIRFAPVELREADGSPGLLEGVLLPWNEVSPSFRERFVPGSVSWPSEGVVLREQHNRQAPIVRFVPTETEAGLHVAIPLPDTQRGRDAATSVRNGTLRGLSVEFRASRDAYQDRIRNILAARLVGAGLVDDPAYAGATVAVRARGGRRRLWL